VFPDFAAQVADLPHVHYGGPYRNPEDLARIYGEVHFAWAIDFYEEGQNSAWLLPNRIYEGTLYGAVPIALAGVETGAWLASHGIGMLLDAPPERNLIDFFGRLGLRAYTGLAEAVAGVPLADLADGAANCKELVRSLVPSREAA
jgi:succinoglycan biosynthesis protein ExoL